MQQTREGVMGGQKRGTDAIALLLIVGIAGAVLGKDLFIDNAVVFHDEYVYKVSADPQLDQALVLSRDLAPRIPNRFFLFLYGFGSYLSADYYAFAQGLNVLFWALGLFFLYRLALETGLSPGRALLYLAAAALLPLSAYTKYFMPESMFFAFFCATVYVLVVGLHRQIDAPLLIAGVLVGLLYFIKPHALALAGVTALFLIFFPLRLRSLTLFGAGLGMALGVGKLVSQKVPAGDSGLGVYGQIIQGLLATLTGGGKLGPVIAEVAAGHALFLFGTFALSFVVVVCELFPWRRLREKDAGPRSPVWLVCAYLLTTGLALMGMSIIFTALSGELGRVHSRYYFFLAPLGLLVLFHFRELRLTRAGKVVALALGVFGPILLGVFGPGYSGVLPISHVSDCPEWGFMYFAPGFAWVGLAAIAAASVWAVLRPRATDWLVVVFSILSIVSGVEVATMQRGAYRNKFTTGVEAVAVEKRVGQPRMRNVVVVGENRDVVSKFLFFLSSTPMVEQPPGGTHLDDVFARHPEATHLVVVSPGYVMPAASACSSEVPGVTICTR